MRGRTDIDQYYGAASSMQNCITLVQGGFKRRGGLEHIDECLRSLTFNGSPSITAPNGGTTGNINDRDDTTTFVTTSNLSTTNPYVVAQYDLGSTKTIGPVYVDNFALSSAGTSDEFFLQVSSDAASWSSIGSALEISATAQNFSRRVEADYRYVRLARIGSTDLGANKASLTDLNVYDNGSNSNTRLINFEFNTDQSYMLCLTDTNIAVYADGVFQVDIYAGNLTSARLADINWAKSADSLIIFHEDFNPILAQRQGADDYWTAEDLTFDFIPKHAFTETSQTGAALSLGTLTPTAVSGTTTLTFSSGTLPASPENQYFEGNGGRARVLSRDSATVVTVYVEIPFYNTNAIAAADYNYLSGYEDVWSSTRGWPICGTFHTGRLWIGGSKGRPTTAWASRVGLFFDFDPGTSLDDEGIEITLDTDQLNRIINIYSGRDLMIFTSGAEFVVPTPLGEPITPSNVSTRRQSRIGSERGLRVQEIEGGVFYIQNGGQSLQEFIFAEAQQAYNNNLISLLSTHLIANPSDFALRTATSVDDGALLALVRADGNATIATIQRSQNIAAFCPQVTDGTFLATGADYNDLYFTVQRNSVNYLEKINDDHFLDASARFTTGLPKATFFTPSVLDNQECRVVADGSVLSNETPANGSVTIDRNATEYAEIGLWFQPYFEDLPVEFPENKTIIGRLMNISEVVLRLYETTSIKVNGKTISFRGFGGVGAGSPLDTSPPQFSGIKRLLGFRGWDETAQITITQDEPGGLTVLQISKNIELGK